MGARCPFPGLVPTFSIYLSKDVRNDLIKKTQKSCVCPPILAAKDGAHIAPRPTKAQIVGTVVFSHSSAYSSLSEFGAARDRHRIAEDSQHDWDGRGARYAWHVARVRSLSHPVEVASTGQTGFGPRSFSVSFENCAAGPPPASSFQWQANRL